MSKIKLNNLTPIFKLMGLLGLISFAIATIVSVSLMQKSAKQPGSQFVPQESEAAEGTECRVTFYVPTPITTPIVTPIVTPTPTPTLIPCPVCPEWVSVEQDLWVSVINTCSLLVTWEDVEYEDGYSVLRRDSASGTWQQIANVPENTDEYRDLSVPCQSADYTYRVQPYTSEICLTSFCPTDSINCACPIPTATQTPTPTPTSVPTLTPTLTPTSTPQPTTTPTPADLVCELIEAYDLSWNQITPAEFANLEPDDTIYFVVYSQSGATGARMRVNGGTWQNAQGPTNIGANEVFYIQYTILAGVYTFEVEAELLP